MSQTTKYKPGPMGLFDALQYRLPAPGIVSILHRASGALMLILLPFIVWMFDASVTSEISHAAFVAAFTAGVGVLPGWLLKLVALALIWAFLHHFIAGLRHLWMDVSHAAEELAPARRTAFVTLGASLVLTVLLGIKLFFS